MGSFNDTAEYQKSLTVTNLDGLLSYSSPSKYFSGFKLLFTQPSKPVRPKKPFSNEYEPQYNQSWLLLELPPPATILGKLLT